MANAVDLSQANFSHFIELAEELEEFEKITLIIAVRECGYDLKTVTDDINAVDIELYEENSFSELAKQFVEDGLYGEIPISLQYYIDYEAIGRDLAIDYGTANVNRQSFIYRCG